MFIYNVTQMLPIDIFVIIFYLQHMALNHLPKIGQYNTLTTPQ